MAGPLACLLVTPISPQQPGNGLAHRCRFWERVLGRLGTVRTLVVPVSGQPHPGDLSVPLPAVGPGGPHLPSRARWAPEHVGRAWREQDGEPVDVVFALRADVAGFALGVAAATDAFVAVDLDDDDADLADSLGQADEADRHRAWRDVLTSRADLLLSTTGFEPTAAVPNSVAVPAQPVAADDGDTVLMVGNFTYEPNVEGATWFLEEVLPRVTEAAPEAKVVLAGSGSDRIDESGEGYVEDLTALYRDAAVAVVPVRHGSGTRIKALEAFAAGVPVVGTSIGLSGLPVTPGVDCVVADEPDAFADAVARLLRDRDAARAQAAAARQLVERFDAARVEADAGATLEAAIADRRPTVFTVAPELLGTMEPDGLVVVDEAAMEAHHLNPLAAAVHLLVEDAPGTIEQITAAFAETVDEAVDAVADKVGAAISELVRAGLLVPHHGRQAG